MRIFLILEETSFYQPAFIAALLRNKTYQYVGAALVTKVPAKNSLDKYFQKYWYYLKPIEISKLVIKKLELDIKQKFSSANNASHSVSGVLKQFGIDYINIEYDINKDEYLNFIASKEPDIIISSNPLIFKKKLLSIPKICSINRHSSLLPSYAGLLPVFHAYRNGENFVGVTIHTMESKIDKGIILAQKSIKIEPDDTVDHLYQKCFDISADLCFEALEKIRNNQMEAVIAENASPSYYAFPNKKDWTEFRQKGGRFI